MSTLLDRYLYAIAEALPDDAGKEDIVAEIRDELQSQIDDGKDEVDAIRGYGHPRVVAARYARVQYLIGPDLFPFYGTTLRNVLTLGVTIVLVAGGLAAILAHDGRLFFDTLGVAWNTALWIVATITIIFVVAERVPQRGESRLGPFSRAWDPRKLPAPSALPPVKRYAVLVEFIANFLALLVLLDVRTQYIPLDALVAGILASGHAVLTPAWYPMYYATVAGSAIVAASAIVAFVRPSLAVTHEVLRALAGAVTIGGIAVTLSRGPWIVAPDGGWNAAAQYCLVAAIVVLLISVVTSIREVWKAARVRVSAVAAPPFP
jgi:hypothetical protein